MTANGSRTGSPGSPATPSSTSTAAPAAAASSSSAPRATSPGAEPDDAGEVLDELAHCLRPLLPGLPAEQRRAVEMIDLDGVAQAEAARREGVSLSGMKSRVQRGRRRLAQLLDACCALTLDARGLPMDYTPNSHCTAAADRAVAARRHGHRAPGVRRSS